MLTHTYTTHAYIYCSPRKYLQGNNIIARISVNSISNSINFTTGSDSIMKSRTYFGPVEISKSNICFLGYILCSEMILVQNYDCIKAIFTLV